MPKDQLRALAFYLPQYHPIPENDAWWGKGFTEWTNVSKARPLFPGHYQPRLPADLGFYDLRVPETREAQAELARAAGLSGFVYYHYWFNGKRLLERPFNEVLASGRPDFPFCLCWANENWTRTWDGAANHVLIAQQHSPEDDRNHIRWLLRAFEDPRYVRVRGHPLLLVYRASLLPDPLQTTTIWREEALKQGAGELYLCRVESFAGDRDDPRACGFDAAVEFQPDGQNFGPALSNPLFGDNRVYDYAFLVGRQLRKPEPPYRRYPCVTPGWDNYARRQSKATILINSSPLLYEKWLRAAVQRARQFEPEERLVFINAWNEWGEGNYLEPDQVFGHAYLDATRRALQNGPLTEQSTEDALLEAQAYIRLHEAAEKKILAEYSALEEWAHKLEKTVVEQQAIIKNYHLLLAPLRPILALASRIRRGLLRG